MANIRAEGLASMPSIWADGSDNQPTGAAPQGAAETEPPQFTRRRGDGGASSASPDDEDAYDGQIRLPPRIRTQFGGGLRTAGDAYVVCEALFSEQIERAATESALPNVAISGDSGARTAFLLLLTDTQQRELFLKVGSNPAAWPRLKSLVGSPPYHFLLPSDAGALNAAGFARGRVNMTYDQGGKIASHSQFGPGQLVDEHTREYRVAPRKLDPSDPLPGPEYFRGSTKDIVLQVKVKKHGLKKKQELFHSVFKKQLLFPQPGEIITLRETERLLSALGLRVSSNTSLRVKALWPRSQGGSTAAVLVGF